MGFTLPFSVAGKNSVVPNVPKLGGNQKIKKAAQNIEGARIKLVDVTGIEPVTPCLQSVN